MVKKRALIYLPALGHTEGASVGDLARRLAAACRDQHPEATYTVQEVKDATSFGSVTPPDTASTALVVRTQDTTSTALAIFELGYSDSLLRRFERSSRPAKALKLMVAVGMNLARLARSLVAGRVERQSTKLVLQAAVLSSVFLVALTCAFLVDRGGKPVTWEWEWLAAAAVSISTVLTALSAYLTARPATGDVAAQPAAGEVAARPATSGRAMSIGTLGAAVEIAVGIGLLTAPRWQVPARYGWVFLAAGAVSLAVVTVGAPWARRFVRVLRPLRARPEASWWLVLGAVAGGGLSGLGIHAIENWTWGRPASAALIGGVLLLAYVSLKIANPDLGMRVQLAIGFGIMGWLTAYTILVFVAVGAQAWSLGSAEDKSLEVIVGLGTAAAAGGLLVSPAAKERLHEATADLLAALTYMSMGEGRDSQVGRFRDLVNYLVGTKEFDEIDVVGYSFGSVIALDALYPRGTRGGPMSAVKRLVTIGCPMITIGTFWPRYWEGRCPTVWTGAWVKNVYSPFDILSSHITEREDGCDAAVWITPKDRDAVVPKPACDCIFNAGPVTDDLPAGQKLLVGGLTAHASYWRTPYEGDRGAIDWLGDMWEGAEWTEPPPP